jgi:hypothetical protein
MPAPANTPLRAAAPAAIGFFAGRETSAKGAAVASSHIMAANTKKTATGGVFSSRMLFLSM